MLDPTKFEIDYNVEWDRYIVTHPDRPNRVWYITQEMVEDIDDECIAALKYVQQWITKQR